MFLSVTSLPPSQSRRNILYRFQPTDKDRHRVLRREMRTPKRLRKNMTDNENNNATSWARHTDGSEQTIRRRPALANGVTLTLHDLYLNHAAQRCPIPCPVVSNDFLVSDILTITSVPRIEGDEDLEYVVHEKGSVGPASNTQSESSSIRTYSSFASLAEARIAQVIGTGIAQIIDVTRTEKALTEI